MRCENNENLKFFLIIITDKCCKTIIFKKYTLMFILMNNEYLQDSVYRTEI